MRASEKGGCLNATGSISIAEHAKQMVKIIPTVLNYILIYYMCLIKFIYINQTKAQGRPPPPRINELFVKTRTKKSGDLVDDRSRRTIVSCFYFIIFFVKILSILWHDFHVAIIFVA